MHRCVPPAIRRSRFSSHLLAGIAAAPLLLASAFADEVHHYVERLEVALVSTIHPESMPKTTETHTLPLAIPAEFADLMLHHEQAAREVVTTAALGLAVAAAPAPVTTQDINIALAPPEFIDTLPNDLRSAARALSHPLPRATIAGIAQADITTMKAALAEYKKGNLAGGDDHARRVGSETARLALEWAAIRTFKQGAGFERLMRFAADNPDLPMAQWVENRAADALFVQKTSAERVLAFFEHRKPDTSAAKIALARALSATGKMAEAHRLVRDAFRDDKTNAGLRSAILSDFPGLIQAADFRYLAERLIYEGQTSEGMAVAAKAGPQALQLTQLLAASVNENGAAPGLLTKLDLSLRAEPAALFAQAQQLRRTGKPVEAAQVLLRAPHDLDRIVDGDEWWIERRMLTRKLLDAGDIRLAYKIAAGHLAESSAHRVDAEVHAGWVALRFLNEPATAANHFAKAHAAALTPPSLARALYWQGRAAEALNDPHAFNFHASAAKQGHTFYGQLALARLGQSALPNAMPRLDEADLRAATANRGLRVIRALLDADARELAQPLIFEAAKSSRGMEHLVALGDMLAQYRLPKLTLQAGKLASQSGLVSEEHAFPTFGIPKFDPVPNSAESAIVYSIARQESEFDAGAVSHAGARGLMQLMPATARRTADRQKIPLDVARLTTDPVMNARIGAAHLGELFGEYNGSYILSFAAYNAGGKRVKEWTTAYGDPRDPNVDTVDWIERIPITETRHYVQKIMENVQIYRARLSGQRTLGIAADLQRGARQRASAPDISTARLALPETP